MDRRALYLAGAVGAVGLFAAFRKSDVETIAPVGFDISGLSIPDIINNAALLGGNGTQPATTSTPTISTRPAVVAPVLTSGRLTRAQALDLAASLDRGRYNHWFSRGGRSTKDVVAIWVIESALDPRAVNMSDPNGGAWGLGQVLADNGAAMGYSPPETMLDPTTGAVASMNHLIATWNDLARRLGHDPSVVDWVKAYNAGPKGYLVNGVNPIAYYLDWQVKRALI